MAKLGIVHGNGLSSILTKFFTGSKAYHALWITDEYIYDMHLIRRRRNRNAYDGHELHLYDFPFVTQMYLEQKLSSDESTYGWRDYMLFALRPLYHLFGMNTRNANGVICSEMCNIDLVKSGYHTPWGLEDAPPSPKDLEDWAKDEISNCQRRA
jgi:hypothetical protein